MCPYWHIIKVQEICISVKWQNKPWELLSTIFLIDLIINLIEYKILNYH